MYADLMSPIRAIREIRGLVLRGMFAANENPDRF
jgi:hypothetical protein